MGPVRLRLLFDDRHMLNKAQKKEGLKRTWIHLKPHHKTISDLASYLSRIFNLHHACPNGLLLSMDGFVLPLFESTCILKDKDLICVKRKQGTLGDIIKVANGDVSFEEEEIVEKQPVATGVKLLANEEFEKEAGGYKSESEEGEEDHSKDALHVENASNDNTVSKKRKASTKLRSSKRKKNKCASDVCPSIPEGDEDVENDVHADKTESCIDYKVFSKKVLHPKNKSSGVKVKPCRMGIPEIGKRSDDIGDSMLTSKRCHRLDKDGKGTDAVLPNETKKLPSRSARRKKAKRRWLRESSKVEKKELNQQQSPEKNNQQSPEKDNQQSPEKDNQQSPQKDSTQSTKEENHISREQQGHSSDVEEEVFPVVVRPGHIRFEPLGKDHVVQQNQISVENLQWNGITSKKKGQKWGKEKASYSGRSNNYDLNLEVSGMLTTEEELPDFPTDFDKLMHYAGLPQKGDVVAYCLIELSSSWCPEISSFRAGKISRYDPETNKVTLESVPEYPVVSEKCDDEEASASQLDTSLYNEDGTLEIDFSSLVDVRIIKHGNLDVANAVSGTVNETPVSDKDTVQDSTPNGNSKEKKDVPLPENGNVNMWDEISQVLSAKKAQLSQEDGWNKKESSRKNSWSYKALRGSALGPTMAILRAQNEL